LAFAACSAQQAQPPVANSSNGINSVQHAALNGSAASPHANVVPHRATGTHGIQASCCANKKTLFVSDSGDNAVQMFDFPSDTYIGQLSAPPEGFNEPQGMCSDNKGDVYVANTGNETVDEFSHSGTFVQSLSDSGEYPVACAFDRSTGNLAVSNIYSATYAAGSIAVYKKATGTPQLYTSNAFLRMYFLSYMGKTGVLYFDAESSAYAFGYGSLSNGTLKSIDVKGATIKFPGTVAYSAKTRSMNVGDQDGEVLYQISPTGTITGSTYLTGAADIIQGTIKGSRFVGPDAENEVVENFAYPKGGNRKSTISGYFEYPVGSAISPDSGSD
jgi:DNA-binding beta-propeller fold protein YncE